MIKKRSRFWTVIFSFLPGAGHMFNGFMKLGISFMGLFFVVLAVASFLNIGALAFLAPVIWFYAFFDCINRTFQDDEEFYTQEDYFLFTIDQLANYDFGFIKRKSLIIGAALVAVGVYSLWNNVVMYLINRYDFLPREVYSAIYNLSSIFPQLVIGVLIIWAGVTLILGKKKQIEIREKEEGVNADDCDQE
ncbi:hypothetical protein [Sinanaerobacter chloroacetimidivorans]|jgi:hypothetical protein|uniref:Uncharacterized protein n=1 Tax=Sinanaerobacter chloroacetimidivorans TaxID=2818044 RepID=A0A8J7W0P0_9FIRM|nr:hypothetical protein [Sinanaerobacter chloroacetimidivorans]MBR0597075.1 hypothetical protein [Sinanaerobacter chloroacetimidivorans]